MFNGWKDEKVFNQFLYANIWLWPMECYIWHGYIKDKPIDSRPLAPFTNMV